jgi:asparagine synthase (glutamine-hydrolysing)
VLQIFSDEPYLSGGVDSGMVVALAQHLRGEPIPTFTIRIAHPGLDETGTASLTARHLGAESIIVPCRNKDVQAAECPVIDTSCAAVLRLARVVHERGYKVALTGEGSDEWLAGYPWYKIDQILRRLDFVPGLPVSQLALRAYLRLTGAPRFPRSYAGRIHKAVGGHNAWINVYGLMSLSKLRFFSPALFEAVADRVPYADLGLNAERLRRLHPLNRGLYLGARIMLPGLLMQAKGDRVAMHSSVETRYPFLDEDLFGFLACLHPRWKLRGLRDKYLLRLVAERWLPPSIARRPKAIFRAPFDSFHTEQAPGFVEQLVSEQSLRRTGYFCAQAVSYWQRTFRELRPGSGQRLSVEMGLAGVIATQLWHHTFLDGSLADLPSLAITSRPRLVAS